MGITYSNLKCLYLPAQSGKTRKIEELIREYKEISETFGDGDINIIISANNKVLVEQTKGRMINNLATDSEENDAVIKKGVFSWMSGSKECNISPHELTLRVLQDEVEMVVMCSHSMRLKYLNEMISSLCKLKFFKSNINIWIDEADKSINMWSKYEAVLSLPNIQQVTLVSATFDTVFSKYGNMNVMGFYKTHPECYRRLSHSIRIECNHAVDPLNYVKTVIEKNIDTLVRPGVRAFIPGHSKTSTHDDIADFLHKEHNFVVVIINGSRKEILVPGGDTIDLRCYMSISDGKSPDELNRQLAKLYTENVWENHPFAITGHYCIQRGVTFQCDAIPGEHDGFMFDYGVIPPIANKADAYQIMARLFGNVGHFPNYKPVEIYTSTAMFNKVEKQEEMAVNIARIVEEQGLMSVGKKELKEAENFEKEKDWDLFTGEFNTLEEASQFAKSYGAQGKTEKTLKKNGEFYLSTTSKRLSILNYDAVKSEMENWTKLSAFDPADGPAYGRLFICYKNTSDPSSVVFIFRIIRRKLKVRKELKSPKKYKLKIVE